MAQFIRLTQKLDQNKVIVNLDSVALFVCLECHGSLVVMKDKDKTNIEVMEFEHEIWEKVQGDTKVTQND